MPKFVRAALGSPRLEVSLQHTIGQCALNVEFELREPWTILFGASGSGKSTVLRAIAGLVRPAAGQIVWTMPALDDDENGYTSAMTVLDTTCRVFVPPHLRFIPLAVQTPSLFPHRSVVENVLYGARGADEAELLRVFRIEPLRDKRPAELSGGEAQRVHLARAAAAAVQGGILLLDEPFTGLDPALRSELILDLRAWALRRELAVLSVTHDVGEAFELGAEVVTLANGRVSAQGPVEIVLAEQRARLLAALGDGLRTSGQ